MLKTAGSEVSSPSAAVKVSVSNLGNQLRAEELAGGRRLRARRAGASHGGERVAVHVGGGEGDANRRVFEGDEFARSATGASLRG